MLRKSVSRFTDWLNMALAVMTRVGGGRGGGKDSHSNKKLTIFWHSVIPYANS